MSDFPNSPMYHYYQEKTSIIGIVRSLTNWKDNFNLTDEENVERYLGVEVARQSDGSLELTQAYLISRIIKAIVLEPLKTAPKYTPITTTLLYTNQENMSRKEKWSFRSIVWILSYLQDSVRPDISMATQQCASFCSDPKISHEKSSNKSAVYSI